MKEIVGQTRQSSFQQKFKAFSRNPGEAAQQKWEEIWLTFLILLFVFQGVQTTSFENFLSLVFSYSKNPWDALC